MPNREILIDGGVALIPLLGGKFAIIDADDVPLVKDRSWRLRRPQPYVQASTTRRGVHQTFLIHRVIMNAPRGVIVDHKDGDILNNRRSNLRFATQKQNIRNSSKPITNTSGFKGAYLDKPSGRWVSKIYVDGKQIYLGRFSTAEEAHASYFKAAQKCFGEFARAK